MKTIQKIELTAFLYSGAITGEPGDIVAVDDSNRAAAEQLVKDRGARAIAVALAQAGPAAGVADSGDAAGGDDDDSDGLADGLSGDDSVEALSAHKIAPRYVQALKDAGLNTIADVLQNRETLAAVAGLSPKAITAILSAIE